MFYIRKNLLLNNAISKCTIVPCCCRTECSKLVFLLIRGLVTSRLDYGNATLFGISDQLIHRLEMVRQSTVRIVMPTRRSDRQSMTTILASNEDMIFVTEKIDNNMNIYMCSRYQWNLY